MFYSARTARSGSVQRPVRTRAFPVEARRWVEARTATAWPGECNGAPVGGLAMHADSRAMAADAIAAAEARLHPLAEPALEQALAQRRARIDEAFAHVSATLERLAHEAIHARSNAPALAAIAQQWALDFGDVATDFHWARPLPWGQIHAHAVLATFAQLASELKSLAELRHSDGEAVETLVERFGFHAIDLAPCADGRLAGLTEHILRLPPGIVTARRSYAGAMFDIDEAIAAWRAVELQRRRHGAASERPTRFLKIGVYHFSGTRPGHEGCAAHASDDRRAMQGLLERLTELRAAVEVLHGESIATLLVGVDTDQDAIRVHVADPSGQLSLDRFVSSAELWHLTRPLDREAAKRLIRERVAACARVPVDDKATEGMRWLCGYLLKNNIGQIEAVARQFGGAYPELGHAEKLIVAGDPIDQVQLRNLAFQTQFTTLEEGEGDIAVGLRLLGHTHAPRGLAVPILAHAGYDPRLPGARRRAAERAARLARAIDARHGDEPACPIVVRGAVGDGSGHIEFVTPPRLVLNGVGSGTEGH